MHLSLNLGNSAINWSTLEEISGHLELSGDSQSSYSQFMKIMTGEVFELTPPQYGNMSKHFVSSSYVAPLLMPKDELKQGLRKAESLLKKSLSTNEDKSYLEKWCKIHDFLDSLRKAKIDIKKLESLKSENDSENSRILNSFKPDEQGYAKKVRYNTSDSLTGRMKVISGPQVLTAPHEVRQCIQSSYDDGKVIMVDFVSVEPRIALMAVNKETHEDVYSDILEEFPSLDRKAAKLATLVSLYGGRVTRLSEVTGDLGIARKAISFVKSHFRVEQLERLLQEQAEKDVVRNIFGRPLREATRNPRIRTNHFLQSSAAELSAFLFAEVCQKFPTGVKPLFLIHDALVVDVENQMYDHFVQECNSISWSGNKMPVKIENLSPI